MSNYREVRKNTAEKMGEGDGTRLPCMRCKTPTAGSVLAMLGARCTACYEAYCRTPVAEFNAGFKRGEPKLALPRREVHVGPGQIGALLAKAPTRDQVREYAEDLGIDTGDQP